MNRAATIALLPLSGLYGAAVMARYALYKGRVLRVHRAGAPVISVGNVTAGGTGKTPLVEWIARYLAGEGRSGCILTRGYGRAHPNQRVVVSDGKTILADAREAGDEALLLAEQLLGQVALISDADRVVAAQWAIENLKSNVFILDDGFQHLRIARDLNIVTIDATNPWGNGLIPGGRLREPRRGLARADGIVITRANQSNSTEDLRVEIDRFSKGRPVLLSRMKIRGLRPVSAPDNPTDPDEVDSTAFAAFCGIGNPQSFFAQLRSDGYALAFSRAFGDHHKYTQTDIDELQDAATGQGARALLTTAKDEVKLRSLRFDLPCYVVEIEIEIEGDDTLRQLISKVLQGNQGD